MARPRRWSHHYFLILLVASPVRAQTRPAGGEVGIDAGFAPLSTSLGPGSTGYAASAHGGYELRFGLAPELEMGLADFSGAVANESTFWFSTGLRYTTEYDRFAFWASSHIGYGHMDANGVTSISAGGLAIDFAAGLLVHGTPEVAFGPRIAATHIDLFRPAPILAAELWYEIGAGLQLTLRP